MAALVSPAAAWGVPGGSAAFGGSTVVWQQRLMGWLFGSSTNPLMQDGFCGEELGGVFHLTAAVAPVVEVDCEIPAGMPIVGTPAGSMGVMPWDGDTEEGLLEGLAGAMANVANPSASLDGRALDVESGFAETGVYTMAVEDGSFIKTLYPASPPIPAEGAKVASAAWVVRIHPLAPGQHELVLADELFLGTDWVAFTATFNITVRPGPR